MTTMTEMSGALSIGRELATLAGPAVTWSPRKDEGDWLSPGECSRLPARAKDGKTSRRPATWRWVAGPNATTEDGKLERRFVGLPRAIAGRQSLVPRAGLSPPALRALGLRAIFRRARRAFDRACFANTLHLPSIRNDTKLVNSAIPMRTA